MMKRGLVFALTVILSLAVVGHTTAQPLAEPEPEPDEFQQFSAEAASTREIYTVRGIAVDEVADTAAAARQTAIDRARRIAFARLVRRIVLGSDQALVPDVTGAQLADLVKGFEVAGEKSRGTRYLAEFTIRFDEDRMRALLRRSGARFSETAARPRLVVPVYETAGARALWEEPNPWKSALAAAIAEQQTATDGLVPLRMPRGDLQDLLMLSADQAVAGDRGRLHKLAGRYGLSNLLIAHAVLSFDARTENPRLTITIRNEESDDAGVEVFQFDAEMQREPSLLTMRAARALVRQLDEGWKRDTWLDFAQQFELVVTAPLTSLSHWQTLRSRLEDVSRIRGIAMRAMSVQYATIKVTYLGTVQQLQTALAQRGLELLDHEGYWLLRQPAG